MQLGFQILRDLASHTQDHKEKDKNPQSFPCSICGSVYSLSRYLNNHLKNHDLQDVNLDGFLCDRKGCGETIPDHFKWRAHSIDHKDMDAHLEGFECIKCGSVFQTRRLLAKHDRNHESDTQDCFLCEENFTHPRFLANHLTKKHEEESDGEVFLVYTGFMTKMLIRFLFDKTASTVGTSVIEVDEEDEDADESIQEEDDDREELNNAINKLDEDTSQDNSDELDFKEVSYLFTENLL